VLFGDGWRRALILVAAERARISRKAGLPPRHRRKRRDPDGQSDGGFYSSRRLPRPRHKSFAEAASKWLLNANGGGLSCMHSGMFAASRTIFTSKCRTSQLRPSC